MEFKLNFLTHSKKLNLFTHFCLAISIFIIFFNLGCSTTNKIASPMAEPKIHNLANPFLRFWEKHRNEPTEKKVSQFKKEIIPIFPEFYNARIERWNKRGENSDKLIASHLEEFPKIEKEFRRKNSELEKTIQESLKSFSQKFPDINPNFEIYVIHSLGEMDGGTRQFGEKNYFILGIDGMVKYHQGFTSEVPFFHHELFHVYHGQYLTEDMIGAV